MDTPRRRSARRVGTSPPARRSPDSAASDHRLLDVQRSAGNAAVGELVRINREPPGALDLSPRGKRSLVPRAEMLQPDPVPSRVRDAITAWLESHKMGITMQVDSGTISMPEVIASIRDEVAGAKAVEPWQVTQIVRGVLGRYAPPDTRGTQTPMGQQSELAARLGNVLGTKVEVGNEAANLVVKVSGALATVKAGGVEARAEAGAGGVKGTVDIGGRVKATATPSSVGFSAPIPMGSAQGKFAAKLSKSGDSWSKWSASFSFPVVGDKPIDARPAVNALESSVREAEAAISDIAGHLAGGGAPADDFVRERIAKISPAIKNVGAAVKERKGPNVTVKIGGSGGPKEVGGQRVQESTVGVSVVIEF